MATIIVDSLADDPAPELPNAALTALAERNLSGLDAELAAKVLSEVV
jgi:hypothetical protein